MKQSRLKVVLFVLIAFASIGLLALALQQFNIFSPNASGAIPQTIIVSNVTDTSATISWATPTNATVTSIRYGTDTTVTKTATDFRDTRDKATKARETHYVNLTDLEPNTTYYYRIVSGDTLYPAEGTAPSTFKTVPTTTQTLPTALTLYGDSGTQTTDGIVIVYVPGALGYANTIPQSTVLNTDGTWVINIATARNTTGEYLSATETTPVALVAIGDDNKGIAKTYKMSENPVTLDFSKVLTQGAIDSVLLTAVTVTPSTSGTATPTPTVTNSKQDVPLRPIGTGSVTPTPTSTTTIGNADISREQLLASFSGPSVSNVTSTSISIMYVTSSPVISTLGWGTSATSLSSNRMDDKDQAQATSRYIHHYTLPSLTANTQYFFKPTSESTIRTFTTPATVAAPSGQTVITGTMTNAEGECLVRSQLKRNSLYSSIITTIPNSSYSWSVNVMPVRTSTLDTYMMPVATDQVLTNAFCIATNGDVSYYAGATTLQNAVTSGMSITLTKLQ